MTKSAQNKITDLAKAVFAGPEAVERLKAQLVEELENENARHAIELARWTEEIESHARVTQHLTDAIGNHDRTLAALYDGEAKRKQEDDAFRRKYPDA